MSLLTEIGAKLVALGLGTLSSGGVAGTIRYGIMPATPDELCVIYETGGLAPENALGSVGIDYETPSFQIVFRGTSKDYLGPRNKAYVAYTELAKVEAEQLSGVFYHWIKPSSPPLVIGRDDDDTRIYMACNFLAQKEPS